MKLNEVLDLELPFAPGLLAGPIVPFPRIPTHISIVILEMACMDDGEMARTLCLVSKPFYTLAQSLLFHSISIYGIDQMEKFAARLERDPRAASTVRYLFIADRSLHHRRDNWSVGHDEWTTVFEASHRILALVAPFLESLCLMYFDAQGCYDNEHLQLFATPFPHLRELTTNFTEAIQPTSFPALERLHVHADQCSTLLSNLAHLCPQLTHLKATGFIDVDELSVGSKEMLGITLTDPREISIVEEVASFQFPSHLVEVILQPELCVKESPPPEGWRSTRDFLRNSIQLWRSHRDFDVVVETPVSCRRYIQRAKVAWLNRLDGGKGCWEVEEQFEP